MKWKFDSDSLYCTAPMIPEGSKTCLWITMDRIYIITEFTERNLIHCKKLDLTLFLLPDSMCIKFIIYQDFQYMLYLGNKPKYP